MRHPGKRQAHVLRWCALVQLHLGWEMARHCVGNWEVGSPSWFNVALEDVFLPPLDTRFGVDDSTRLRGREVNGGVCERDGWRDRSR